MGFIRWILGITAVVAIIAAIAGTQLMPPISIPPMLQPTVDSLFDLGKVDFVRYDLTPDRADKLRLRAVVANGNAVPVEGIEVRCALLDKKGRAVDDETFQFDQRIGPGAQREVNATVPSHPRGEWTNAQCFVTAAAPVQKPLRAG
ncbi:MAG: FxLYD domain-containing protein [Alphaproteobacteria bacterium]